MKSKSPKRADDGCCTRPALKDRPLLSPIQAGGLAAVFKVLANDTRLRLLHALVRADELCVTDLAAAGWSAGDVLVALAVSLGLAHHGEPVTVDQLVDRFDPESVPRAAVHLADLQRSMA